MLVYLDSKDMYIFLPEKDIKTSISIESIPSGEKKGAHRSNRKSAKRNLKAACSWISYDRNAVEFQF